MAVERHFRDVECWRIANLFKVGVYRIALRPAVRADMRLCLQLRESAGSACRNIAEAVTRRVPHESVHFLDLARASLTECQQHVQAAVERGYAEADDCRDLLILGKRALFAAAALQRTLRRPA